MTLSLINSLILKLALYSLAAYLVISCSASANEITKKKEEALNNKGNVVAEMLEQARQFYLTALEKQNANLVEEAAQDYESALRIINNLSYYPSIDDNEAFIDLETSIIHDYKSYVDKLPELPPGVSLAALEEWMKGSSDEVVNQKYEDPMPHWIKINSPVKNEKVFLTAIDQNIFLISGFGELYVSADNGLMWRLVHNFNEIISGISAVDNKLFVGTSLNDLFISTDNGVNWLPIKNTMDDVKSLTMLDNLIFVSKQYRGVFLSTDNGANWNDKNSGLPITNTNYIQSPDVTSLVVIGKNILAGTSNHGIYLSTNNGEYWIEINGGLTDKHINALAVSDSIIFAGTNGGVFFSTNNGNNWVMVDQEINISYEIEKTELNGESINHQIQPGETIIAISELYDVSVDDIKRWNNLSSSKIVAGKTLIVYPNGHKSKVTSNYVVKQTSANYSVHKVKKNETLGSIAEQYKVSIASIQQLNKISGNKIIAGQYLKIPKSSGVTTQKSTDGYHIVASGETLYSISIKYNTSVQKIKTLNNLSNSKITVGQNLKIYTDESYVPTGKDISSKNTNGNINIVITALTVSNSNIFAVTNIGKRGTEIWYRPIAEILNEIKNE